MLGVIHVNTVPCYQDNWVILFLKKMPRFGNAISCHSSLIQFQVPYMYIKIVGIALANCKKKGFDEHGFWCSMLLFLYIVWSTPTKVIIIWKLLMDFFKKIVHIKFKYQYGLQVSRFRALVSGQVEM